MLAIKHIFITSHATWLHTACLFLWQKYFLSHTQVKVSVKFVYTAPVIWSSTQLNNFVLLKTRISSRMKLHEENAVLLKNYNLFTDTDTWANTIAFPILRTVEVRKIVCFGWDVKPSSHVSVLFTENAKKNPNKNKEFLWE